MTEERDDRNDPLFTGGVSRRGFLGSVVPAAVGVAVANEALSAPAKAPAPVPEVAAGAPSGGRNGHRRPVAELVG